MGEACGTHGRYEKCIQNSGRTKLKGIDRLADLGIDGMVILKWSLNKWDISVWTVFM
jgi:hypothetical protein